MRQLLLLPAFAAAFLLAACDGPAEFGAPLSTPGTAPHDERLIGSWYSLAPEGDGMAMLVITPRADGLLDAAFGYMSVEPGDQGHAGLAWHRSAVHASVIGGLTYYNARVSDGGMMSKERGQPVEIESDPLLAPHPERGYWIVRSDIGDDGHLMVEILSESQPKKLGLPSHEIACGSDCSFTVYDLDSGDLAELIASVPEAELFTIRTPFARFGAPPPPSPE
jgi:hypothetical protein